MANLKEIRVRIASVTTTRQITSAMKMVSAAKLKRAQDAVVQLRPYAQKMSEIISNISQSLDAADDNIYGKARPVKGVLMVLITSNRGLCGAFNSNVVKTAIAAATGKYDQQLRQGRLYFMCIGKKGHDMLKSRKFNIFESHFDILDKPSFEKSAPIAQRILDLFTSGKVDKVVLVYNMFKNAGVQILAEEQFLPVKPAELDNVELPGIRTDFIYEPGKEMILQELIPQSLKIDFHKAILDSHASEHGARMTAMHKATDNASELIKQLTLNYNKARQASITGEILEIVGGAEALRG